MYNQIAAQQMVLFIKKTIVLSTV